MDNNPSLKENPAIKEFQLGKFFLEDLRSAVQVISEEFGSDWLAAKTNNELRGRSPKHPIRAAWAETIKTISKSEQAGRLIRTGPVIQLVDFANNLAIVRKLPNYEHTISSRMKNNAEYLKIVYEVFVAAWWTKTGYIVEFIPRQHGKRTPEMKIISEHGVLYIECKSRDSYIKPKKAIDKEFWRALKPPFMKLRKDGDIEGTPELIIILPGGPDWSAVPKIVDEAQNKLRAGFRGQWVGRQAAYVINDLESIDLKSPEEQKLMLRIPTWQNPAIMMGSVGIDSQGHKCLQDQMRIAFFSIDSYKLSAIGNSFEKARRQLSSNAVGLIYINLDVLNLDYATSVIYIEMVADSLATQFSPELNTRIAAVVVTTEWGSILNKEADHEKVGLTRLMEIRRNPHCSIPDGISIPGEA